MVTWAIIKNAVVVNVVIADQRPAANPSLGEQAVRIDGLLPHPGIGWIYLDLKFTPPAKPVVSQEDASYVKMSARFDFGNELADEMIKRISMKNIALGKTSTQVAAIIGTFTPLEMALRKCALTTALGGLIRILPVYSEYSNEFSYAVNTLTAFLASE